LLCIAALQSPLLDEHRPHHRHPFAGRQRLEIRSVERIMIVPQVDQACPHRAATVRRLLPGMLIGWSIHNAKFARDTQEARRSLC
jgi:hypothetical protein